MVYHYFQIGLRKKRKSSDLTIQLKLQPLAQLMEPLRREIIIPN